MEAVARHPCSATGRAESQITSVAVNGAGPRAQTALFKMSLQKIEANLVIHVNLPEVTGGAGRPDREGST
jgi:hypothetical protein